MSIDVNATLEAISSLSSEGEKKYLKLATGKTEDGRRAVFLTSVYGPNGFFDWVDFHILSYFNKGSYSFPAICKVADQALQGKSVDPEKLKPFNDRIKHFNEKKYLFSSGPKIEVISSALSLKTSEEALPLVKESPAPHEEAINSKECAQMPEGKAIGAVLKNARAAVFCDTEKAFSTGYLNSSGNYVTIPPYSGKSKVYRSDAFRETDRAKRPLYTTAITVENDDSFAVAERLQKQDLKPLVLNLACRWSAGGGVVEGSGAQEETLCRCSNLLPALQQACPGDYEIPRGGAILTPEVTVFRDRGVPFEGYNFKDEPFQVDVVSAAGICLRPEDRSYEKDKAITDKERTRYTRETLLTIFRSAVENGNDSLVLGALGCGAYDDENGTNKTLLVSLLTEILGGEEFKGVFKNVTFAVMSIDYETGAHLKEYGLCGDFTKAFDGKTQEDLKTP